MQNSDFFEPLPIFIPVYFDHSGRAKKSSDGATAECEGPSAVCCMAHRLTSLEHQDWEIKNSRELQFDCLQAFLVSRYQTVMTHFIPVWHESIVTSELPKYSAHLSLVLDILTAKKFTLRSCIFLICRWNFLGTCTGSALWYDRQDNLYPRSQRCTADLKLKIVISLLFTSPSGDDGNIVPLFSLLISKHTIATTYVVPGFVQLYGSVASYGSWWEFHLWFQQKWDGL